MLTNCVCCCIKFVVMYWVHSETCKPKFLASGRMQYQNDCMQHTFSDSGENCVINWCSIFLHYYSSISPEKLGETNASG